MILCRCGHPDEEHEADDDRLGVCSLCLLCTAFAPVGDGTLLAELLEALDTELLEALKTPFDLLYWITPGKQPEPPQLGQSVPSPAQAAQRRARVTYTCSARSRSRQRPQRPPT